MPQIMFKKDLDQDASILDLYNTKVDLTAFNAAINDINTNITNLQSKHESDINDLQTYIDDQVQSLKDNEIKSLQDAITLLNADSNTEGSVDYKIKTALDALINGAGEAYDTLKEIVDYINSEASDFQGLIDNLNAKIDAIVGNASDDYNTLEKIEQRIKEVKDQVADMQGDTSNSLADVQASIPQYNFEKDLAVAEGNKITLAKVPASGIVFNSEAKVYITDNDGNMIITGIFTCVKDPDDDSGKVFKIECPVEISSDSKAMVSYFWREADQA